jgi:DNA-binding beta-propeller fold protein YncE
VKSVKVLLCTFLIAAFIISCRDKDATEIVPPELSPPLGLAFSAPLGKVSFFSLNSRRIVFTTDISGWSLAAVVDTRGDRLYFANNATNQIYLYHLPEFTEIDAIPIGGTPLDLYSAPNSSLIYVTTLNGFFWSCSFETSDMLSLHVGLNPRRMAILPQTATEAWVACTGDCSIHKIDLSQFTKKDTIQFTHPPSAVCFSPDGHKAYVALTNPGEIRVLDRESSETLDSLSVGQGPFNLGISGDSRYLAISDSTLGFITVWDMQLHERHDLFVGSGSGRIRFERNTNNLYVLSSSINKVMRVEITEGATVITDTLHIAPTLREITLWESSH